MSIVKLNHWFTLSANLGVLAGIVFLAVEIQQTNEIAKVTTEYEIRNSFSNINEILMTVEELSALLIKSRSTNGDDLTLEERTMLGSWVRRLMNGWIAIELAYRGGLVSEETYSIIFDDIAQETSYDGALVRIYRSVVDIYEGQLDTQVMSELDRVLIEKNVTGLEF